jgi:hypothetical protein
VLALGRVPHRHRATQGPLRWLPGEASIAFGLLDSFLHISDSTFPVSERFIPPHCCCPTWGWSLSVSGSDRRSRRAVYAPKCVSDFSGPTAHPGSVNPPDKSSHSHGATPGRQRPAVLPHVSAASSNRLGTIGIASRTRFGAGGTPRRSLNQSATATSSSQSGRSAAV